MENTEVDLLELEAGTRVPSAPVAARLEGMLRVGGPERGQPRRRSTRLSELESPWRSDSGPVKQPLRGWKQP